MWKPPSPLGKVGFYFCIHGIQKQKGGALGGALGARKNLIYIAPKNH
jgi:hypothetical protein